MKQKQNLIKEIKNMLKKDQQVNLPVLDRVHKALSAKSPVYKSWHSSQWQHITQWAVLAVIVILIGGGVHYASQKQVLEGMHSDASFRQTRGHRSAKVLEFCKQLQGQTSNYKAANADLKSGIKNDMVAVAEQRREIMKLAIADRQVDVITQNRNCISEADLTKLPSEVQALMETEKKVKGKLSLIIADDGVKEVGLYNITETATGTQYAILPEDNSDFSSLKAGSRLEISGVSLDNTLVVPNQARSYETSNNNATSSDTGVKRVAVIPFKFQNQPCPAQSESCGFTSNSELQANVFGSTAPSIKSYYEEVSRGQLTITGTVFDPVTLPYNFSSTMCDANGETNVISGYANAIKTAAQANGFVPGNFDNVIFTMQNGSCSGWYGFGGVNENSLFVDTPLVGTFIHEFGHNLGRLHAAGIQCSTTPGGSTFVPISANCRHAGDYVDPYDVMGNSGYLKPFNIIHRTSGVNYQGWQDNAVRDINRTSNPDGTYTLTPLGTSGGIKAIRIPKTLNIEGTDYEGYYYLEFRQPIGYDAGGQPEGYAGVRILHNAYNYGYSAMYDSILIDTNTTGGWAMNDSPLGVGQTFNDPVSGITITTQSVSSAGAVVQVTFGDPGSGTPNTPTCTNTNPSLSIDPSNAQASPGQSITYIFTLTNNDPSACSPSTYAVSSNSSFSGWVMNPSSFSEELQSGDSISRTFTIASATYTTPGTYNYGIMARRSGSGHYSTAYTAQTIASCTYTTPTLSLSPSNTSVSTGQSVDYEFTVRNNDATSCAPSTYKITPSGYLPSWTANPSSVTTPTVAPGTTSAPIHLSMVTGTSSNGQYPYTQQLTFTAEKVGSSNLKDTKSATVVVTGTTSVSEPVVNIITPLNNSLVTPSMTVKATAEIDGGLISTITLYLDAKILKTCTLYAYAYGECEVTVNTDRYKVGSHTISATAVGYPNGQSGTASINVTKWPYD